MVINIVSVLHRWPKKKPIMTVSHFCPSFSLIAFITPAMKYEKRNTNSFLICSVLSVYPRPIITWQVDNIPTSASSMEENGSLGPFYVNSRINITGSNSSYECAIENSLLEQTWTGRWTMKGKLHRALCEHVLHQRLGGNKDQFSGKERKCICSSRETETGVPGLMFTGCYYLKPSLFLLSISSSLIKQQ